MTSPSEDQYPVSEDLLRLESEERRFHQEVNHTLYLSWGQVQESVDPGSRYRISYFSQPKALTGIELLDLAYETLTDRSCTYIDNVREVRPEYEIPVEDYRQTHTDPATGQTVVDGGEEDFWDISYFVGTSEDEEVGEEELYGMLAIVGLSVEVLAEEVIARRCEETGVDDPEASPETMWAVRRAVSRGLVHEYHGTRTLGQALFIARGRASEVFDRAYAMARIRRAGVDLDQHPEFRSLQAFYELGVRPPTHQEAADVLVALFGEEKTP